MIKARVSTFRTLFNTKLGILASAKGQEKEVNFSILEKKICLYSEKTYIIIYVENPMESTKKCF